MHSQSWQKNVTNDTQTNKFHTTDNYFISLTMLSSGLGALDLCVWLCAMPVAVATGMH